MTVVVTEDYAYQHPGNPDTADGKNHAAMDDSPSNKLMREIAKEAEGIVTGDRQKKYGLPKTNHTRTAAFWSAYLGITITAQQVCAMNRLQKESRHAYCPTHDNLVDIIGFAMNEEACA